MSTVDFDRTLFFCDGLMKRAFTTWQLIGLLALLGIIAAILFPVFARKREVGGPRFTCQSQLKHIGLGFAQYLQDYNEKFPPIASGGAAYGWADALHPYLSAEYLQCPQERSDKRPSTGPRNDGYTDYWYNANLATRNVSQLSSSAWTIINGDGNVVSDRTDARYAISTIPRAWVGYTKSPLYRHLEGANYGFADGHVKWYAATKMETMNPNVSTKSGVPTFALK